MSAMKHRRIVWFAFVAATWIIVLASGANYVWRWIDIQLTNLIGVVAGFSPLWLDQLGIRRRLTGAAGTPASDHEESAA
jgi:hypothetical protein